MEIEKIDWIWCRDREAWHGYLTTLWISLHRRRLLLIMDCLVKRRIAFASQVHDLKDKTL